ncbi:hypothetical protein NDU88_010299 [Pleurodeles waltl]|uniref:Uncharacterized protein n=1 Tax=Pleurodeles waltl TaxID=8319 RepID=A0AAV7PVJ5_PLEWA|nr:hypothetical protein NDU88_010299 [Pleurodeles waltl]
MLTRETRRSSLGWSRSPGDPESWAISQPCGPHHKAWPRGERRERRETAGAAGGARGDRAAVDLPVGDAPKQLVRGVPPPPPLSHKIKENEAPCRGSVGAAVVDRDPLFPLRSAAAGPWDQPQDPGGRDRPAGRSGGALLRPQTGAGRPPGRQPLSREGTGRGRKGEKKQKEKRTQAHREPLRDIPKDTPGSLPSPLILHSAESWRLGPRGRTRWPSVVGPGHENRGARNGSVATQGSPGPTVAPCGSDLGRGANQPGYTCCRGDTVSSPRQAGPTLVWSNTGSQRGRHNPEAMQLAVPEGQTKHYRDSSAKSNLL